MNEHVYSCAICNYTTYEPAALTAHMVERHRLITPGELQSPMIRDGRLANATELLADHLASLLRSVTDLEGGS